MALVLACGAKMGQGHASKPQAGLRRAQGVYHTLLKESEEGGGHAVFTAYSVRDGLDGGAPWGVCVPRAAVVHDV